MSLNFRGLKLFRVSSEGSSCTRRARRPLLEHAFESLEGRRMFSTLPVTSALDDVTQHGTLRYAVAHAQNGDRILLTPAVQGRAILLTHGELLLGQQGLTIESAGNSPTTISGGGVSRIFELAPGASVTLSNLAITGGNGLAANGQPESHPSRGGGAVVDAGAELTVSHCNFFGNIVGVAGGGIENFGTLSVTDSTLTGNSAGFGGGIFNLARMTGSNVALTGNSAATSGGGLYNGGILTADALNVSGNSAIFGGGLYSSGGAIFHAGSATVSDSTLSNNVANFGAGIYNYSIATVAITNTVLSGNTAFGSGGGIENLGKLAIGGGVLTMNSAVYYGGGVANFFGTVTVSASALTFNTAFAGGGISNWADGGHGTPSLTVSNSDISHNTAAGTGDLSGSGVGGGIFNRSGDVSLRDSTLEQNTADFQGGGVCTIVGGTFTISGGTLSGNSAQYGGGIFTLSAMTVSNGCTLSDNTAGRDGGGIYSAADLTVDHCTLSGNTAGGFGGAIYSTSVFGDTGLTISDSTLSGNTATDGGAIANHGGLLLVTDCTFIANAPDDIFG